MRHCGLSPHTLPSYLQMETLSPYEAVATRFMEQYKTFAMALDTTRHELPVRSVHVDGDGQRFLGRKRRLPGKEHDERQHVLGLPASRASLSLRVMSQASSQVDGVLSHQGAEDSGG